MLFNKTSVFWVILLLIIATLCRFVPGVDNFTPFGAIMLFGGAMSNKFRSLAIVAFITLFATDLYFNNYVYPSENWTWFYKGAWVVYSTYALVFLIGRYVRPKLGLQLGLTSIASSIVFFIITNIGVWYSSGWYTVDSSGFVLCFVKALPFFKNSLISDLMFSFALFGSYYFITAKSKVQEIA